MLVLLSSLALFAQSEIPSGAGRCHAGNTKLSDAWR
jgi:hypothetical protein